MGLLDDSPERWDNFRTRIIQLNDQLRKENAKAKVFFFARHGQGWRTFVPYIIVYILFFLFFFPDNVAEAKYGTQYWDE